MSLTVSHRGDLPPFQPLPDRVQPSDPSVLARCLFPMRRALLLGCRPPAAPGAASYDMCSRVLGHLVRAGLGMQEDTELCGRAHARTPGAKVHLHHLSGRVRRPRHYRPRRRL